MRAFAVVLMVTLLGAAVLAVTSSATPPPPPPPPGHTAYGLLFSDSEQVALGVGVLGTPTTGMSVQEMTDSQVGRVDCIATSFAVQSVSFAGQNMTSGSTPPSAYLPGSNDPQSQRLFAAGNVCQGFQAAVVVPAGETYVSLSS